MSAIASQSDRTGIPDEGAPLRVAFHTLGCRLNQVDTEGLKILMSEHQPIAVVDWSESADLYILNSCTVTAKADQECRRLARQVKRRHPRCKVVVAGCYAQAQPGSLAAMPEIDGVVGNANKQDIAGWLPAVLASTRGAVRRVDSFASGRPLSDPVIAGIAGRNRAFVKVQDGCDLRCSYCLIWQARGPGRSRPPAAVLAQLSALVARGFPECIVTGVHLGSYGRDLRPHSTLCGLLRTCLEEFPALRLRLSSIHPDEIGEPLLELLATREHLRPHLHISLQSGSDRILALMRRPYRSKHAREGILAAAAARPGLGLGADLIVGFPGETEEDFAATCALIEELPFTYLHVFRFSPRPGTPAADLPRRVHPETITARSAMLRSIGARKQETFARSLLGTRQEVVVETASEYRDWRQATAANYVSVRVPATLVPGRLLDVDLTTWRDGRLWAADPADLTTPTGGLR